MKKFGEQIWFGKSHRKYISEELETPVCVADAETVELAFEMESTQVGPHSGRHCDHGNCDENEAKK